MAVRDKTRIGVVGAKGFPAWGGAARANEAIFTRLNDQYDITVYAMSSHAVDRSYYGIRQIIFKAHRNRKFSTIQYYLKCLLHILFRERYDIVHVNHGSAGFLVPLLRLRCPVVHNIHGLSYDNDTKWKGYEIRIAKLFEIIGFKFATKIATVQKSSVECIQRHNFGNVIFIPNGVENNAKLFPDKFPIKYDLCFSAARIIHLKGLHLLLEALGHIGFKGAVQVIGDVNQDPNYKREIIGLSRGLKCHFWGLVDKKEVLFKKLRQSRIFVFPSYSEGMSNMLLEVASLKVPVIASDIRQNTDIFSNDEMLFFRNGNYLDLAEKIAFAFENLRNMEQRAEKAYYRCCVEYSWEYVCNKYRELYQAVISQSSEI